MDNVDISVFAETILDKYGATADLEALKRANRFFNAGDRRNGDAWLEITDRIRELQNRRKVARCV